MIYSIKCLHIISLGVISLEKCSVRVKLVLKYQLLSKKIKNSSALFASFILTWVMGAVYKKSNCSSSEPLWTLVTVLCKVLLFKCASQAFDGILLRVCVCVQSLSCVQLCDPMGCSPPGSSARGILQEWVAISSSRGSSQPRERSCISCIGGGFTTEPLFYSESNMQSLYSHPLLSATFCMMLMLFEGSLQAFHMNSWSILFSNLHLTAWICC